VGGPEPDTSLKAVTDQMAREDQAVFMPTAADPNVKQVAEALCETQLLIPGGVYFIAFNKKMIEPRAMSRVVDYLAAQNIRVVLVATHGNPKDAVTVTDQDALV